jgi:HEAT repeat protein
MLLQYLPDTRGVIGLGALGSRRAEPALVQLFEAEQVQRLTAVEALYHFREPASVRALVKSLDDPDGLVRHHASSGLVALHGLPDDSQDPQHMMYRVKSNDAERHDGGKRDILAAIAGRPISAP